MAQSLVARYDERIAGVLSRYDRVVIREVFHWCATRAQAINRIGLTRYAGVATLATVSISPGESAISILGFI